MSLYVIGDLHLAFNENKPMTIFGDNWENHYIKIKNDWESKVKKEDTVQIFFFQPDICFTEKDILADYKKEYNQYRLTGGLKTPEDIPFIIEYNGQKDKFTILYDTTNIPKIIAKSVGAKTNGVYIAKFIDENENSKAGFADRIVVYANPVFFLTKT